MHPHTQISKLVHLQKVSFEYFKRTILGCIYVLEEHSWNWIFTQISCIGGFTSKAEKLLFGTCLEKFSCVFEFYY